MTPQVQIVLATYNGERFLGEQLDSILANSVDDFSIEIYDDGSTDRTLQIAREYEKQWACVHVHENESNLGYTKNFLHGVRQCRSPYIMLCDQDDIWKADKISRTLAAMKKLEGERQGREDCPLLVFTDAMNYDSETGRELGSFHKSSRLNADKTDPAHLLMENKCNGCTMMINAAVLPYLRTIPDEVRVHDWWLALICSCFGKILYLPEMTLQYRQHRDNMIGGRGFGEYFRDRVKNLREQREALARTFAQAEAFYRLYGDQIPGAVREQVQAFSRMGNVGALRRRWYAVRYGFYKSGFMRNAALFLIL